MSQYFKEHLVTCTQAFLTHLKTYVQAFLAICIRYYFQCLRSYGYLDTYVWEMMCEMRKILFWNFGVPISAPSFQCAFPLAFPHICGNNIQHIILHLLWIARTYAPGNAPPAVRSYFAQIRSYFIRIRSYTYVVTYVSICVSYVWAHPWEMQAQLCGNARWNVLKCYLNCQPYVTHMLGKCRWRSYIYDVTRVRKWLQARRDMRAYVQWIDITWRNICDHMRTKRVNKCHNMSRTNVG